MGGRAVYKADPKAVAIPAVALAGPGLITTVWVLIHPSTDGLLVLAALALLPLVFLAYALSFRATFSDNSFSYEQWGKHFCVRFRDIEDVELIRPNELFPSRTWAVIHTRQGHQHVLWLKLFPKAVEARLAAIMADCARP